MPSLRQPAGAAPAPAGAAPGAVVFLHPDLGIGGAERLVVDAAVGLQARGHRVVVFTNHCDARHCFDECRDGTLDVRVRGAWPVPPTVGARLAILCAVLRHLHLVLAVSLSCELPALRPRAFVADQLSAGLPLLRALYPRVPVLFYCHFPDLLLARGRRSRLKRLYRRPFDWLERWSMGFAHAVTVNSDFTRAVVDRTWPRLKARVPTRVVYPCVDTAAAPAPAPGWDKVLGRSVLSINRFERKKDVGLAIRAFALIPEAERQGVRLVVAGGYDARVAENVEHLAELQALASSLRLAHHTVAAAAAGPPADVPPRSAVLFLLSVPGPVKAALLAAARLVVYTPAREHFGIVPLEAMRTRRPVLAADSGGPVETVSPDAGWLRDPADPAAWAAVMRDALAMPDAQLARMGAAGAARIDELFGRDRMAERLDAIFADLAAAMDPGPPRALTVLRNFVFFAFFFCFGLALASVYRRFVPR